MILFVNLLNTNWLKSESPILGCPNVMISIIEAYIGVFIKRSTAAKTPRAPPRECPVINRLELGYISISSPTYDLT